MAPTSMAGIDVGTCLYCKGVWLNNDSLNKLLHLDHGAPSKEELQASFESQNTSDAARQCPVCVNVTMNLIIINNVEIDRCPKCGGLFFDDGELVKVLPNISQENKEFNIGG